MLHPERERHSVGYKHLLKEEEWDVEKRRGLLKGMLPVGTYTPVSETQYALCRNEWGWIGPGNLTGHVSRSKSHGTRTQRPPRIPSQRGKNVHCGHYECNHSMLPSGCELPSRLRKFFSMGFFGFGIVLGFNVFPASSHVGIESLRTAILTPWLQQHFPIYLLFRLRMGTPVYHQRE